VVKTLDPNSNGDLVAVETLNGTTLGLTSIISLAAIFEIIGKSEVYLSLAYESTVTK